MNPYKNLSCILITAITLFSCETKDEKANTPTPSKTGNVKFYFENVANVGTTTGRIILDNNENSTDSSSSLNSDALYTNAYGNELNINKVRYWVSNVVLYDSTFKAYAEPNSYHLIDLRKKDNVINEAFTVSGVPLGKYRKISFSIGVDPAQNYNITNLLGDLSPNVGMSWTLDTGYIFFKMEGRFKKSNGNYAYFSYHIGKDENYRIITLNLPEQIEIEEEGIPSIHLKNNILAIWGDGNNAASTIIDLNATNSIHGGVKATTMANNYTTAVFRVDHIHNYHHE